MTNLQTAIEALETIVSTDLLVQSHINQALTALRAMEGQMVSREAIATALCGAAGSVGGDWRDKKMVRIEGSKDRIVDAIYALQLPAPRWIPVSERLPELDEEVLVYHGNGSMEIDCIVDWVDEGHGWEFSEKVTHWQYLPEAPHE